MADPQPTRLTPPTVPQYTPTPTPTPIYSPNPGMAPTPIITPTVNPYAIATPTPSYSPYTQNTPILSNARANTSTITSSPTTIANNAPRDTSSTKNAADSNTSIVNSKSASNAYPSDYLGNVVVTTNRDFSSTPLPLPSNNFSSLGYTFVLINEFGHVEQEITLAVAPQEFQQIETSTSTVILTAGDVFTDSFGPGLTAISLSGTFGQRPTGNTIFGTNVPGFNPVTAPSATSSGQYLVLQLRDLFRKYLDRLNPLLNPNAYINSKVTLQFFNPKDNEFWNIEPVGDWFTLSRSKTGPFLYQYKLSFVCTGRATLASNSGLFADIQSLRSQYQDFIAGGYKQLSDVMTNFSNYTTGVINALNYAKVTYRDFYANILTPLSSLQLAVGNFLGGASSIINFPVFGISQINKNIRDIQSQLSSTDPVTREPIPEYNPYLDNLLVRTQIALDNYALYPNNFIKQYIKSDFVNQSTVYDLDLEYVNLNTIANVSYYVILDGDTIEGISFKTLGDIKFWKSIAEFNGLAYPYISSKKPKPDKALGPGDTLVIPIISTSGAGANSNNLILGAISEDNKNMSLSYGNDFYINSNNDISLTLTSEFNTLQQIFANDIVTVYGIPNLMQAIRLKLNVYRGELMAHPFYGISNLKGYRTEPFLTAKSSAEFRNTMLSDSRISKILNQNVAIDKDIMRYSAELSVQSTNKPIIVEGSLILS